MPRDAPVTSALVFARLVISFSLGESPVNFRAQSERLVVLTHHCFPFCNQISCGCSSDEILLEQVKRYGKKNNVLHQEGNIADHRRKATSGRSPAIRHERDDRYGAEKCNHRSERTQHSKLLVPESGKNQCSKQPLRNTQKIGGHFHAKDWIHPKNERSVSKEGNQALRFVSKPLLIAKKE